jgi:hypothetical protein
MFARRDEGRQGVACGWWPSMIMYIADYLHEHLPNENRGTRDPLLLWLMSGEVAI